MKTHYFLASLVVFLSGCGNLAWHLAQTPPLSGISQRMGDRKLDREISGDPIAALQKDIKNNSLSFKGLMDIETNKTWIPGITDFKKYEFQAEYLCVDDSCSWLPKAESYYSAYNTALLKYIKKT